MKYSIIIPIYNEEGNILRLTEALTPVLQKLPGESEVLLIDDGSKDKSFDEMKRAAEKNPRIKLLRFSRNFGQTAALSAGFENAKGDIFIPMDADFQNDPVDIPRLVQKLDEGFDVVSGWRKDRKDKAITRKLPSAIANRLISIVTGVRINDYGCTLKAYRRTVLDGVRLYGEMHRFIPAYAAWNGARVTEIEVTHHPRTIGKSKYSIARTLKVALDLLVVKFLTTYFTRPMHFFGLVGFFSMFFGGLSGLFALILKYGYGVSFILTPLPLLTVFLILLGVLFILLGLVAEMITRVYYESQGKSTYTVGERINF